MGVRRERVYRAGFDIQFERSQPLDRVDDEQSVALAAKTANRGQIVAKAAREFYEAQSHDARAVVNQRQYLLGLKSAVAFARHLYLYAEFALDPHPRDDVGRKFAIGGDDVVARAPVNAVRDHGQTSRRVGRKRYLFRAGVDQSRRRSEERCGG